MLEIKGVTKIYRSKTGEEVRALDDVSITFPEQGMVFILGKSGSGKSTLLNVMGGLDSYDKGEFIIKGKSSNDFVGSDFDAYRNTFIGFIFQEYNVLDDFTVGANIGLALELQGKKATEEKINEILASVDLLNFANRKPNELSGGQKQRVAIARALVKEPQIIMADEPTGALDSNTGKQIFDTLKELSKTKLVLIVSHDRDFAERYADRIVELSDGKIIEDVTKHEQGTQRLSEGVHLLSDNLLRIEGGYKLTTKDLDMINAYLAKVKGDVLLSGDDRVNDELRSAAGVTKDGGTATFAKTGEADIKTRKYEKHESKFIRSRLPMKNAVKMGSSGLKHKKFRLVMTILLSFISFAMFGLSSSMAAYDKVNAATQSIIDSQIRSAAITMGVRRTTTYEDGEKYSWHESHALNDEDIAKLKDLTGLDFLPVFTGYDQANAYSSDQNFDMEHVFKAYEGNSVFSGTIAGLIDINEDRLPSDYQLMAGRWRAAKGEVVITELFLRQLQEYGYTDGTTVIEGKDVTADAMIGKTLTIRNIGHSQLGESQQYTLTIVGVLNTNFDYNRYQSLLPKDDEKQGAVQEDPSLIDMFLEREVRYERDYGFHGMAFAHGDDIKELASMMGRFFGGSGSSMGEDMYANNSRLYLSVYRAPEVEGDNPASVDGVWIDRVGSSSLLPQLDKITWSTAEQALAADEMLLSYTKLANGMLPNTDIQLSEQAVAAFVAAMTAELGSSFEEYAQRTTNVVDAAKMAFRDKYISDALAADPTLDAVISQKIFEEYGEYYWGTCADFWKDKWSWRDTSFAPEGAIRYTYSDMEKAFANNTVIRDALITLLGLPADTTLGAYGFVQLINIFEGSNISYSNALDRYSAALLSDYFVSQGYHLMADGAVVAPLVNEYINSSMEGKVSEWRSLSESERIARLTDYYRWEYMNNAAKFGGGRVTLYENAFSLFLNLTNQTIEDVLDTVNSLLFRLEETTWGSEQEIKTLKTDYSEHKVVGFFVTESNESDNMVVSDTLYAEYETWKSEKEKFDILIDGMGPNYTEERVEHTPGNYAFALAPISAADAAVIQKLVEMSYADPDTTDFLFEMQNAVMYTLGNFNDIIEVLSQVFVWLGLGLALFSALLLMNFISTSISYKKREIGILRAVGARSSDVFKIFFSEAFIIALINFALAVVASVASVLVLNYYMRNSGINITLLSFGPVQIAIMLGVSVAVALLASFLPVNAIARKKPVDAIKDR